MDHLIKRSTCKKHAYRKKNLSPILIFSSSILSSPPLIALTLLSLSLSFPSGYLPSPPRSGGGEGRRQWHRKRGRWRQRRRWRGRMGGVAPLPLLSLSSTLLRSRPRWRRSRLRRRRFMDPPPPGFREGRRRRSQRGCRRRRCRRGGVAPLPLLSLSSTLPPRPAATTTTTTTMPPPPGSRVGREATIGRRGRPALPPGGWGGGRRISLKIFLQAGGSTAGQNDFRRRTAWPPAKVIYFRKPLRTGGSFPCLEKLFLAAWKNVFSSGDCCRPRHRHHCSKPLLLLSPSLSSSSSSSSGVGAGGIRAGEERGASSAPHVATAMS